MSSPGVSRQHRRVRAGVHHGNGPARHSSGGGRRVAGDPRRRARAARGSGGIVNGPQPLRAILERWTPGAAALPSDPGNAIASAWADAVGPEVARRTRPGKLHDGVLTVYTAGSVWSHQLTFLAPT